MPFFKQHKHHVTLWIILVLLDGVSGYVGFVWQPRSRDHSITLSPDHTSTSTLLDLTTQPLYHPTTTVPDHSSTTAQKNLNSKFQILNSKKELVKPLTEQTQTITIPVTLAVNGQSYSLAVPEKSTAYDFMNLLQQKTAFRFAGRDYGGQLGFFVDEINGIKNNPSEKKNWIYYINKQKAQVGISTYQLQANDNITWKFEAEQL